MGQKRKNGSEVGVIFASVRKGIDGKFGKTVEIVPEVLYQLFVDTFEFFKRLPHGSEPFDTGFFRNGKLIMDPNHIFIQLHALSLVLIDFGAAADLYEKFAVFDFDFIELVFILGKAILVWAFTQAEWQVVLVNMRLFLVGQYPIDQIWRLWVALELLAVTFGLTWGTMLGRRYLNAGAVIVILPVLLALFPKAVPSVRLGLILWAVLAVGSWFLGYTQRRKGWVRQLTRWLLLLYFPLLLFLVRGLGEEGFLKVVPTNLWGGLLLTFLLAIVGIGFSFPLGILLARGQC